MKTVRQFLRKRPQEIIHIAPEESVFTALEVMEKSNVGALLVMQEGRLLGIFSERDYARKGILKGRHALDTPVQEVMTPSPHTVSPDRMIENCMELMTENRFRHLPVEENGEIIGVISIGDVVKESIAHLRFMLHEMEKYIAS